VQKHKLKQIYQKNFSPHSFSFTFNHSTHLIFIKFTQIFNGLSHLKKKNKFCNFDENFGQVCKKVLSLFNILKIAKEFGSFKNY